MDKLMILTGTGDLTAPALAALVDAEKEAAAAEAAAKIAKNKRDELRAELYATMMAAGIRKIQHEQISVTCVLPQKRETFDRNRMLAENPDLAEIMAEYISYTPVAGGVRVKLHGDI